MKVEIKNSNELSYIEQLQIETHTFLNMLNILFAEFIYLDMEFRLTTPSEDAKAIIMNCKEGLQNPSDKSSTVKLLKKQFRALSNKVREIGGDLAKDNAHNDAFWKRMDNIRSIIEIFNVRLIEFDDSLEEDRKWKEYEIESFLNDLRNFLNAIAKNSNGKFGIVYDKNLQGHKDYNFDLNINASENKLELPVNFRSIIRDLLANSRKFSSPGTTIKLEIIENKNKLILKVSDEGIGIPESEIHKTTEFGYRASNAIEKHTNGAGIGLTKAMFITKSNNGKMWIDSTLDQGTEITLEIPRILN